jgi:hypothetical protein
MKLCPVCGANIFVLVDCVCDSDCQENRSLAWSIMKSCSSCKSLVKEELNKKKKEAVIGGGESANTASVPSL